MEKSKPTDKDICDLLHLPVPEESIKWRQSTFDADSRTQMLAYIDARYVMDVLDNSIGSGNWENEYIEIKDRIFCRLSLTFPSGKKVSKMDCGSDTVFEAEKGVVSDALKRVAVLFGIGRDLYSMPKHWADTNGRGYVDNWTPPASPLSRDDPIMRESISEPEPKTTAAPPPKPQPLPPTTTTDGGRKSSESAFVTVEDMVCYSEPEENAALLLGRPDSEKKDRCWLPKSQIRNHKYKSRNDISSFEVPKWLADSNGLSYIPF